MPALLAGPRLTHPTPNPHPTTTNPQPHPCATHTLSQSAQHPTIWTAPGIRRQRAVRLWGNCGVRQILPFRLAPLPLLRLSRVDFSRRYTFAGCARLECHGTPKKTNPSESKPCKSPAQSNERVRPDNMGRPARASRNSSEGAPAHAPTLLVGVGPSKHGARALRAGYVPAQGCWHSGPHDTINEASFRHLEHHLDG